MVWNNSTTSPGSVGWLGSRGPAGQVSCLQQPQPPRGHLEPWWGRLEGRVQPGWLDLSFPPPHGLFFSRTAVFTTRQLLSSKCGSTVARPSQGLGSELAYFLLCHILFIKMSHRASPDALWEGRLYKAVNTGRHGSLAGVFGNQLLHWSIHEFYNWNSKYASIPCLFF